MKIWKSNLLHHEGFRLITNEGNLQGTLTNVRYADDLLLFANTLEEGIKMMESLAAVLDQFGLELNTRKTKILST